MDGSRQDLEAHVSVLRVKHQQYLQQKEAAEDQLQASGFRPEVGRAHCSIAPGTKVHNKGVHHITCCIWYCGTSKRVSAGENLLLVCKQSISNRILIAHEPPAAMMRVPADNRSSCWQMLSHALYIDQSDNRWPMFESNCGPLTRKLCTEGLPMHPSKAA